jgi:hypothetical protein
MRASSVAEKAGIRSVSVVASDFMPQARAIVRAQGTEQMNIAEFPSVIMAETTENFRRLVRTVVLDQIVAGFAESRPPPDESSDEAEPDAVVFEGNLDEVLEFFHEKLWTDGLPIVPPTRERVDAFLEFTDRSADEVIAVLPPLNRQATVRNVAVNGVMAGCRPEYMPVLLAIVEVIAEPVFRLEDAGSTPGWEPLVIVSGPLGKELDFNVGTSVMRIGRQANSSIGRFTRLYMRNVVGFLTPPGVTDKGCISYTFNVAVAEDEEAIARLGWETFGVEQGFARGGNVVTVQSVVDASPPIYSNGESAEDHVERIAEVWGRGSCVIRVGSCAMNGNCNHLLMLGPAIAAAIARDGWTKADIRRYLYENVKVVASVIEKDRQAAGHTEFSFAKLVAEGTIPAAYHESDDPDRLVPVFLEPDSLGIIVAGGPGRNQSRGYVQNHNQGPRVSKQVVLPAQWEQLRAKQQRKQAGV